MFVILLQEKIPDDVLLLTVAGFLKPDELHCEKVMLPANRNDNESAQICVECFIEEELGFGYQNLPVR